MHFQYLHVICIHVYVHMLKTPSSLYEYTHSIFNASDSVHVSGGSGAYAEKMNKGLRYDYIARGKLCTCQCQC
jgi:hypothetical protein